ncbi:hypothetical protein PIB30_066821 [Stylosanthes scabra]|uniref:Putative plant transposon protein domain-containing protein n=1 Tax=Stylosanthes scabra TaxID=79078 RepID=A0ABU6ULD6_9FABA|nr:hypothetical protein [Stylosanthes scabra]
MASSSAPASVLDDYRFREVINQTLFESHVRRKKIIPEQAASPRILCNAAVSDEEVANARQLPYKSFVRGVAVDFSQKNIQRVMRFKAETLGVETDYRTRQAIDQRVDEEFIIHSLVPTANKSEITVARPILIHSIMRVEEVRAEDIIADNMAVIAQGLQGKGNLSFPSTIYKLCKDAGVPLREFRRTSEIPEEKLITAKRMESTRIPRNIPAQQQEDDDEDEQMPLAGGGNEEEEEQQQYQHFQQPPQQRYQDFQPTYESQYHQDLQGIEEHLSSMQFLQQSFYENMKKSQAEYMEEVKKIKAKQEKMWNNTNRFQSQIRKE